MKNFLDEILNYRSAGPLSVPVPVAGTGTKRKILAGPKSGPKKNYWNRDRDQIKRVTGTWTGTGTKKNWSCTCLIWTRVGAGVGEGSRVWECGWGCVIKNKLSQLGSSLLREVKRVMSVQNIVIFVVIDCFDSCFVWPMVRLVLLVQN